MGFISALRSPQIKALTASGELQLSLLEETNLAEIRLREFPGEHLIVCLLTIADGSFSGADRARRAQLHPAHQADRAAGAGLRVARPPLVAKALPARSVINPVVVRDADGGGRKLRVAENE